MLNMQFRKKIILKIYADFSKICPSHDLGKNAKHINFIYFLCCLYIFGQLTHHQDIKTTNTVASELKRFFEEFTI